MAVVWAGAVNKGSETAGQTGSPAWGKVGFLVRESRSPDPTRMHPRIHPRVG